MNLLSQTPLPTVDEAAFTIAREPDGRWQAHIWSTEPSNPGSQTVGVVVGTTPTKSVEKALDVLSRRSPRTRLRPTSEFPRLDRMQMVSKYRVVHWEGDEENWLAGSDGEGTPEAILEPFVERLRAQGAHGWMVLWDQKLDMDVAQAIL